MNEIADSKSLTDPSDDRRFLLTFQYQDPYYMPEDVRQLHSDIIDVLEGDTDINTFDDEYQERIKNYYRFGATFTTSKRQYISAMTRDTFDLI